MRTISISSVRLGCNLFQASRQRLRTIPIYTRMYNILFLPAPCMHAYTYYISIHLQEDNVEKVTTIEKCKMRPGWEYS
jgi:hypothetical protein